jgi:hypothetical protein
LKSLMEETTTIINDAAGSWFVSAPLRRPRPQPKGAPGTIRLRQMQTGLIISQALSGSNVRLCDNSEGVDLPIKKAMKRRACDIVLLLPLWKAEPLACGNFLNGTLVNDTLQLDKNSLASEKPSGLAAEHCCVTCRGGTATPVLFPA